MAFVIEEVELNGWPNYLRAVRRLSDMGCAKTVKNVPESASKVSGGRPTWISGINGETRC
jgi:hypothetical protein